MSTANPWDPEQTDEYAVSIGIYCLYFEANSQDNYMKGFKVMDVNKAPNVHDQKEVGHQLASGRWKNHVSLMSDAGDLTVKGHFEFERGKYSPAETVNSRVKGPAGTVMLGIAASDADKIEIFFMCGANVNEDGSIEGAFGDVMGSAVKFKLSGEPKMGTVECGTLVDVSLGA